MTTTGLKPFEMALATKMECRLKYTGTTTLQKHHMLWFTSCERIKPSVYNAAKYIGIPMRKVISEMFDKWRRKLLKVKISSKIKKLEIELLKLTKIRRWIEGTDKSLNTLM